MFMKFLNKIIKKQKGKEKNEKLQCKIDNFKK